MRLRICWRRGWNDEESSRLSAGHKINWGCHPHPNLPSPIKGEEICSLSSGCGHCFQDFFSVAVESGGFREFVRREPVNLAVFIRRGVHGFATPPRDGEYDDVGRFDGVKDCPQLPVVRHVDAEFLMRFPAQGLFRRLFTFDVSSGQVPKIGVDAPMGQPLHEQDPVVPNQDRRYTPCSWGTIIRALVRGILGVTGVHCFC